MSSTPVVYKRRPTGEVASSFQDEAAALEAEVENTHPVGHVFYLERYGKLSKEFEEKMQSGGFAEVEEAHEAAAAAEAAEKEADDLEREVRALEELVDLDNEQHENMVRAAAESPEQRDLAAFERFAALKAELSARLFLSRSVLAALKQRSIDDLREGRVSDSDVHFFLSWEDKTRHLDSLLAEEREAAAACPPFYGASAAAEEEELVAVRQLAEQTQERMQDAQDQRDEQERRMRLFRRECDKVVTWCRKQLANLEAMQDPDHVQEFCATLAESYPAMSKNFQVLLESVTDYVRANNTEVRALLMEANEVWFCLQVASLERLSGILFEIHPTSPLDAEVAKYAEHTRRLSSFLNDLFDFLQGSPETAETDAISHQCEAHLETLEKHDALAQELLLFAARQQALRDSYACLRSALLSRLTFIGSPTEAIVESKRRQQEFEECANGLKAWAAEASHGPAWRDLYAKIVEIKRVIQAEQATLEAQTTAAADQ